MVAAKFGRNPISSVKDFRIVAERAGAVSLV
jgi:hypothetical protein